MSSREMFAVFESQALVPDDERPEAAAKALDETWPYRLIYEVGDEEDGAPLISHENDRERWLRAKAAAGAIPLLTTADEGHRIFLSASALSARTSPYGHATIRAVLETPCTDEFIARMPLAAARVGRALHSYWGMATPKAAATTLAMQIVHPGQARKPPLGLPALPGGIKLASTAVPHQLGWINYWPAAAAALLRFPDPDRDVEWMRHAKSLDDGGWIVQLTRELLDLDRPDHLDAVKRAYERFAEIGRARRDT